MSNRRKFKVSINEGKMLIESNELSKTFKGLSPKAVAMFEAAGFAVGDGSVTVPYAQRLAFIKAVHESSVPLPKVVLEAEDEDEESWRNDEPTFSKAVDITDSDDEDKDDKAHESHTEEDVVKESDDGDEDDEDVVKESDEDDEDVVKESDEDDEDVVKESDDGDEDDEDVVKESDEDDEDVVKESDEDDDEDENKMHESENVVPSTPGVKELNRHTDLEDSQNTEDVENGNDNAADATPPDDGKTVLTGESEDEVDIKDYDEEETNENIRVLMKAAGLNESSFREIKVLWEAAIAAETKKIRVSAQKSFESKLAAGIAAEKAKIEAAVSTYLAESVTSFVKKNRPALVSEAKNSITNKLVTEMFDVLRSNNIEVPKGKTDAFKVLTESHQELKRSYAKLLNENRILNEERDAQAVRNSVALLTEGMTEVEKDKFSTMLESFEFESVEEFNKKATFVKESFFNKKPKVKLVRESSRDGAASGDSAVLNESSSNGSEMDLYLGAIAKYSPR